MYRAIARNRVLTVVLFVIWGVVVVGLAAWVTWITEELWVGVAVLVVIVLFVWASLASAPSLIGAISGFVAVDPVRDARLVGVVTTLAIRNGMPTPRICIIEDPVPNALSVASSPEKATIAVTRGLLELLDDSELEAVVAHELAHIENYDSRVTLTLFGLVGSIGLLAQLGWSAAMSLIFGPAGGVLSKLLFIVFGLILVLLTSAFALVAFVLGPLLSAATSREREYLADASAFEMTRYAEGLVNALQRMTRRGTSTTDPALGTHGFYFMSPLSPGILSRLFDSHPSPEKRIARLRALSREF